MTDGASDVLLTTIDNPFNPFTDWDEWFAFDEAAGYHTPALLARVVVSSDELSEVDQEIAFIEGIDEIVRENVSGVHRKVTRESFLENNMTS